MQAAQVGTTRRFGRRYMETGNEMWGARRGLFADPGMGFAVAEQTDVAIAPTVVADEDPQDEETADAN